VCGRFAVTTAPAALAAEIGAVDETGPEFAPNYNVAPTTTIAVVVARHGAATQPSRELRRMRWGLLPSWVKADGDGRPVARSPLINARAEKVTGSPAFRAAARHRRCLVPMDGYYEWMPDPDVAGGRAAKTPYYMYREDGRPLLVAGLWSAWRPAPAGVPILTCTVITTDAVGELGRVHGRMPLLVAGPDWDRWLDPGRPAPAGLLATPPEVTGIAIRQVRTLVNKVANNGPELIAPVDFSNEPLNLFQPADAG